MRTVRRERWRLVAAVLCVLAAVAAGVTAFVYSLPLPALAVSVGCFLIARYLRTESSGPLTMGPDNGDTEEWMGERFIWEPGDLDDEEAGR
ncbi:hypothetical protein [Streptomyces canus]|uniref:hypothetical protein n=1 Tax=Streptomyces canus TaxID=58343 RepID=UPI00074658FF|nr:hypothetical protein [Streptomyces canus]KUN12754.1 hypothetical protein AQI96_13285 [Streptomyces canus]